MTRKLVLGIAVLAFVAIALIVLLRNGPEESAEQGQLAAEATREALSQRRGAVVDQVVFTQESDAGKIAGLIESGSHHLFARGITNTTIYRRLLDSSRTDHGMSYGTSVELTLNPAGPHFDNGELNPMHVKEIREAMNWLIDRRYIAEELYGGLAVPRFLPINTAFPDYARLAEEARALETYYRHDIARAERVITREMEALGATRLGGVWMYDGAAVRISVLIRTEDERKRVGDYVSNLMQDMGFRVQRMYRTAEEASRIWIASDPNAGNWHIYTGGWISLFINRDLAGTFSDFYTPRGRPDLLWQIYDPDPEFDDIAERLDRRDYADWEERQAMMARGLQLSMQDSVRIWVADQLNVWPRSADIEVGMDLAGGFSGSQLWPYTLRFRDRVGGSAVVATPSILTEPWNPIAGTNWIFDRMVTRALADPPLMPDPFTGLFWPQRIDGAELTVRDDVHVERTHDWLEVKEAGEIRVPDDAWIGWDNVAQRFTTVGEKHPDGLTSRTRTRVYYEAGYLGRYWHDGSQMSLADIVLPWIITFARADENSPLFDRSYAPDFEVFQRQFRGWHIVSTEPLIIDIYNDQVFPDAEVIVQARTPLTSPWHTLALGIRAETSEELTFSSNKADRLRVDWMSMIAGPSLNVLDRHLERSQREGWIPFASVLSEFMRDDGEAAARYAAIGKWREERGHFWVGDGPFYLHDVQPVVRTVVLRRFEGFPDASDKWLRFTEAEIPELSLDGPMVVEHGQSADFDIDVTFSGEPYADAAIDNVSYLLFDSEGRLARKGPAQRSREGQWRVSLDGTDTEALGTGANSLEIIVTSRRVAMPSFGSHAFATVPPRQGALQ